MKDKKIFDELNQTMYLMCQQSPFAFFYFQLVHRKITSRVQVEMKMALDGKQHYGKLISHQTPLQKIKYLPWNSTQATSMIQDEMNGLVDWLRAGKDIKSYFQEQSVYYEKEKELIIERLISLSDDFVDNLARIAEKYEIPIDSIGNIFLTITADDNLRDPDAKLFFLSLYSDISVPRHIAEDKRDEFISGIADQVYNLLVESFWVIIIIDHIEFLKILSFIKDAREIDKIKSFIEKRTCFIFNENIVKSISCREDIAVYLSKNYASSNFFLPRFTKFLFEMLNQVSQKYIARKDEPLSFEKEYEPKTDGRISKQELDQSKDKVFDSIFGDDTFNYYMSKHKTGGLDLKESYKNKIDDNEILQVIAEKQKDINGLDEDEKERARKELIEVFFDIKEDTPGNGPVNITYDATDYMIPYQVNEQTDFGKNQIPDDQRKFTQTEIKSFAVEIFFESLGKKISRGMIMNYDLTGNPEKLIKYIVSIIYNAAKDTSGKYYNQKVREMLGVSSKTLKRYEKDIKNGKLKIGQGSRLGANDHMQDLSLTELDVIKDQKEKNQKHQKAGHLNQTQLIKMLRNDQVIQSLNKDGISLKKMGTTRLKKMIRQLEKDGAIRANKEKTAVFYRREDFKNIATEIIKKMT